MKTQQKIMNVNAKLSILIIILRILLEIKKELMKQVIYQKKNVY